MVRPFTFDTPVYIQEHRGADPHHAVYDNAAAKPAECDADSVD